MNSTELEKWRKAGKLGKELREYAVSISKQGISLYEIAEKIDQKIIEMGAKPAFPVNLSVNEIAAHDSPLDKDMKAEGLLKIDLGIDIDGYLSDTAISIDLSEDKKYVKIIEASKKAFEEAMKIVKPGVKVKDIGKRIQETITSFGLAPIINLSGHEIKRYELHAGLTIPNFDNGNEQKLEEGMIVAIEPFATSGVGKIQDGKNTFIYQLIKEEKPRDSFAREVLQYIQEEYGNLPFTARWLVNKFGRRTMFALKFLEQQGILKHFKALVEVSKKPVSQYEHTILITKEGYEILTG